MQRLFFSAIVICLFAFSSKAQDTLVTQNLRHTWIGLNAEGDLIPYTSGSSFKLIFFELLNPDPQDYLWLQSERAVDVWLNNEMILLQFNSTAILNLDSLRRNIGGRLRIKIFSARGIDESLITKKIRIEDLSGQNPISYSERRQSDSNDLYLITLSIILLLAGVFRRFFPQVFSQSFQNPLSLKLRSAGTDRAYDNFGNADNLYSILFLGAISTMFFTYLGYDVFFISGDGIFNGLMNWLLATAFISLIISIKYLWARLISLLYQYREVPNIQIQDFTRFFTLIIVLGLIFTLIDFTLLHASAEWFRKITIYLVLIAVLFFPIWFFRKFDRYYSHKKLMIISYLCTTEFLPGFLAIYWLVKM